MIAEAPSTNGSNGRDAKGRFAKGNAGGPGNAHARRTAQLRSALLDAVTEDDIRAIAMKMVEQAKTGDIVAAREVLDRTTGKAGIDQLQVLQVAIGASVNGAMQGDCAETDFLARIRQVSTRDLVTSAEN